MTPAQRLAALDGAITWLRDIWHPTMSTRAGHHINNAVAQINAVLASLRADVEAPAHAPVIDRIVAEWGDAVAAIQSAPGAPDHVDVGRAIAMGDLMADALRAAPAPTGAPRATHTVLPPYLAGKVAPIEVHAPCLYARVKTCKELYPSDTDMQCQYCSGNAVAAPIEAKTGNYLLQNTPTGAPADLVAQLAKLADARSRIHDARTWMAEGERTPRHTLAGAEALLDDVITALAAPAPTGAPICGPFKLSVDIPRDPTATATMQTVAAGGDFHAATGAPADLVVVLAETKHALRLLADDYERLCGDGMTTETAPAVLVHARHVLAWHPAAPALTAWHGFCRDCGGFSKHASDCPSDAHGYLSRLLVSHAPTCEPLPDLMGVCTQIDNLLTGHPAAPALPPDSDNT